MNLKMTWLKMTGLSALCAMAATSAQAQMTINIGSNSNQTYPSGVANITSAQFTSSLNDTRESSLFTTGSFSILPSGNLGSNVVFDVNASSSFSSTVASFRVSPNGAGVVGGHANNIIDNSWDVGGVGTGAGPLEWVSFELTNIRGLGAGDQLVITEIGLLNLAEGESHRLDIGSFGVAPDSADVVGAFSTLLIDSDAFSLGAGSEGDTRFTLASITVDVIPEPSAALLGGLGLLVLLRRRR